MLFVAADRLQKSSVAADKLLRWEKKTQQKRKTEGKKTSFILWGWTT
jgi:hypothetical protein